MCQCWHCRSIPLYPCTRVVMWCWGLTSQHHAYLVSTSLSISSPLFVRQTDRWDRETERETGGEKDRDLSSALCGLTCLVLSAVHTRLAGSWAFRHSFSCLDLWLCVRNTGGREGRGVGRIVDMFVTIPGFPWVLVIWIQALILSVANVLHTDYTGWFCVHLTQARVIWGKEAPGETMPP